MLEETSCLGAPRGHTVSGFAVQPTTPVGRINENVYRTLCNDVPGGPSESCESPTVWALVKMASLGGP